MAKRGDRYVVKHPKGWAVKKAGQDRAESVHPRQSEAERSAKTSSAKDGGGEVRIQGRDGRFRDSDTVAPAKDPFPPRDKKH